MKFQRESILVLVHSALFLVLFFAFSLLASTPVHANVDQIYNTPTPLKYLRMKEEKIAWIEAEKVSFYDTNTATTTLIDLPVARSFPDIGSGKIVFQGGGEAFHTGAYATYGFTVYDIASASSIRVNNHSYLHTTPKIENGKVFWASFTDENGESDYGLYMYDTQTQVTSRIGDVGTGVWDVPHYADNLQTHEGKVLYSCKLGVDDGLCVYDISTSTIIPVRTGGVEMVSSTQQLDDGKVVYAYGSNIYLFDIVSSTNIQITNDLPGSSTMPRISNGKIAYVKHDPNSSDNDIYMYDIASDTTTNISNNDVDDIWNVTHSWLTIKDGRILWSFGSLMDNQQVKLYDIATGVTSILASNTDQNGFIGADNGKVAWINTADGVNYNVKLWDGGSIPNLNPVTVTFTPTDDTYVKNGSNNKNTGSGEFMRLQSSGYNRSLVRFNHSEIQSAVGSHQVLSATLKLTITNNGNNWGTTGRTIDTHRFLSDWLEGNGTESSRGTGSGATWSCAIDSNINNQQKNCSGITEWEMGQANNPSVHPWVQTPTATKTISNNQSGVVEFDVTSDVTAFLNGTYINYGWILKKTNEGQNGQVSFGTKESSSVPQLVVTYQP